MATETITVASVAGPNENGWYDVELEDGRTVNTKSDAIAQHAQGRVGAGVEATINERKKGNFTNFYLNEFDGIADRPSGRSNGSTPQRKSGGSQRTGSTASERAKSNLSQETSWAYGRAVEAAMASEERIPFPLDEATVERLQQSAELLLTAKRDTAQRFKS